MILFHRTRRAFTLIELLVTVSIVGVLASMAYAALQGVTTRTRKVREVAAAKNVIAGFLNTPADFNGHYLLGYDGTGSSFATPGGQVISGPAAERYPYRLAPYFDWQLKDTIIVNTDAPRFQGAGSEYAISLCPALGMNVSLVGGELRDQTTGPNFPGECLTMPNGTSAALIAFASAGLDEGSQRTPGYFKVIAPKLGGASWSTAAWTAKSKVADYGQVDARYGGEAVCAFTDGSVRSLTITALRDMRLWSRVAAERNDPNYTPVNTNTGDAGM